jgi:hypothetical protein
MRTSYWIAHPTESGFIAAFSPEGVGRCLEAAGDWPAALYIIRTHRHGEPPADEADRRWGHAVKDGDGDVSIEPLDGPGVGD